MSQKINHKETDGRGMFFMEDGDGITSELTYSLEDNGIMVINHTETREALKGKGLASKLVEKTVAYAKENDLKVDPVCPFAEQQFNDNKAYQEVRVN